MTTEIILHSENLSVGFAPSRRPVVTLLQDVHVSLRSGELVCLIGPNGVGKTTLLRTLAGMQPALRGRVLLQGKDVHGLPAEDRAKRLSLVLTDRVDVGMLAVFSLVALGRYPYTGWRGELSSYDETVVVWALDAVGASDLAQRNVSELSDGERQKVMIARALAQDPALLILDEPTAYLDVPHRVEIAQLLRRLAHETGRAILLSTHDLDLALRSADRVWLLPPGGPLRSGAPEDHVLSGAFEDTFRSKGVIFDRETGAFQLQERKVGTIVVQGDGVELLWTRRALEREGFEVIHDTRVTVAHPHLSIHHGAEGVSWLLQVNEESRVFHTLYDLTTFVKQTKHLPVLDL